MQLKNTHIWSCSVNLVLVSTVISHCCSWCWLRYFENNALWFTGTNLNSIFTVFQNARFKTTLKCAFRCYQRKCNLLKSSLWICHLKMIKMYRKLDRKYAFTSAAIGWSITLERGECKNIRVMWYVYTWCSVTWSSSEPKKKWQMLFERCFL